MKNLKEFIAIPIFAALACAGLHAQNNNLRATIPFDFHVGNKLMPAGEYVVEASGPLVRVRSAEGNDPGNVFLATHTSPPASEGSRAKSELDFNRYGDEYFLTTIWNPWIGDGLQAPKTAREKELAKAGDVKTLATVALAIGK